jgi:hypothetical protein
MTANASHTAVKAVKKTCFPLNIYHMKNPGAQRNYEGDPFRLQ